MLESCNYFITFYFHKKEGELPKIQGELLQLKRILMRVLVSYGYNLVILSQGSFGKDDHVATFVLTM